MSRAWIPLLVCLCSSQSGCEFCKGGEPVPFKKEQATALRREAGADADARDGAGPDAASFQPQQGPSYPDGSQQVELGDASLEIAEGRALASLEVDLDRDGDQDALLLVSGADQAARLDLSERLPDGLQPPRTVAALATGDDGCRLLSAAIRTIAPAFAVMDGTLACLAGPAPTSTKPAAKPGAQQPADASVADEIQSRVHWIVTLERSPRVLDRLQILPPGPGRAQAEISLGLSAADRDADGHPDIVARVQLVPPGEQDSIGVELVWLDRPGGLARDPNEPERSMARQADRAAWWLERNADKALAAAGRALLLHAALCRESDEARLVNGDAAGLSCGRSPALGRAEAVTCAALAKKGDIPAALEAHARLERRSIRLYPRDRKLAERALEAVTLTSGVTWRQGPNAGPFTGPRARLSGLGFVDEQTLIVRGASPFRYHLSDGSREELGPAQGDLLLRDPSGRYAVVDIERSCEGYHLHIVEAARVVAGVVAGPIVSRPLIRQQLVSGGVGCRSLPANLRADRGGYRVLGWTGQGVVVAGASAGLLLVPLDEQASPAGEPRQLGESERLPGRLQPGAATADGRYLVQASPAGIAVIERFPKRQARLLRPEGWSASEARELAVSPSGNRVALVRAGRIQIAER
jgi:hypothetical protein